MDNFALAKERLDIVEVAKDHGFLLNRRNMANCPWHDDKTPSLHFKRQTQRYCCYGCGEHGDVIDLVGVLTNQEPLDVLRELNQSYHLGLDLEKPVPREVILDAQQKRMQRDLFDAWEGASFRIISEYSYALQKWKDYLYPKHPDDPLDPRYLEALHKMDYVDYVLETVCICGSRELKAEFMATHESMIRRIEQRLIWEGWPYAGRNGTGHKAAPQLQPIIAGSEAANRAA